MTPQIGRASCRESEEITERARPAEDGIRVGHVTGVQTCALPICSLSSVPLMILRDRQEWVMAKIISGTELSELIRAEIAEETNQFLEETGVRPGLATVLVGDDPASQVYGRMKGKAAEKAGFHSREIVLPEDTPEEELLAVVRELNEDPEIHGILVQLPLPEQIDTDKVRSEEHTSELQS